MNRVYRRNLSDKIKGVVIESGGRLAGLTSKFVMDYSVAGTVYAVSELMRPLGNYWSQGRNNKSKLEEIN